MTDLRLVLPNRPGALLETLAVLADEDLNIEGFCADIRPGDQWAVMHILVDGPEPMRVALERAGIEVTVEHEVDVLDVENRPGGLAEAVSDYTNAGRNIEVLYTAAEGRVVIGTEDMQRERFGVRLSGTPK